MKTYTHFFGQQREWIDSIVPLPVLAVPPRDSRMKLLGAHWYGFAIRFEPDDPTHLSLLVSKIAEKLSQAPPEEVAPAALAIFITYFVPTWSTKLANRHIQIDIGRTLADLDIPLRSLAIRTERVHS
jgi:hypothetical protein